MASLCPSQTPCGRCWLQLHLHHSMVSVWVGSFSFSLWIKASDKWLNLNLFCRHQSLLVSFRLTWAPPIDQEGEWFWSSRTRIYSYSLSTLNNYCQTFLLVSSLSLVPVLTLVSHASGLWSEGQEPNEAGHGVKKKKLLCAPPKIHVPAPCSLLISPVLVCKCWTAHVLLYVAFGLYRHVAHLIITGCRREVEKEVAGPRKAADFQKWRRRRETFKYHDDDSAECGHRVIGTFHVSWHTDKYNEGCLGISDVRLNSCKL